MSSAERTVTMWEDVESRAQMVRLNDRDLTVAIPYSLFWQFSWPQGDLAIARELTRLAREHIAKVEERSGRALAKGSVLVMGSE